MGRILMIYQRRSSFVKRDIDILSENHRVDEFEIVAAPKSKVLISMTQLFFQLLFSFGKYDFVISQGAGLHSFPAAWVGRIKKYKTWIIAIGTDCANIPKIQYGNFRKPLLARATAFSFRKADLILPVHESLIEKEISYDDFRYPKQGIKNLVPGISTPFQTLHNAYNLDLWKNKKVWERRSKTFLSVSANLNDTTFQLKGFDLIFSLAKLLPNESFSLIGNYSGSEVVPANITFHDNVSQLELVDIYNDHKFYLQLSLSEGFPNALCESMLCGCTPIVSDIGAMPDIVEEESHILKKRDIHLLETLASNLIKNNPSVDWTFKISQRFPLEKRKKEFLHLLKTP